MRPGHLRGGGLSADGLRRVPGDLRLGPARQQPHQAQHQALHQPGPHRGHRAHGLVLHSESLLTSAVND